MPLTSSWMKSSTLKASGSATRREGSQNRVRPIELTGRARFVRSSFSLGDSDVHAVVVDAIDPEVRRGVHVAWAEHAARPLDEPDPEADVRLSPRDVGAVDEAPDLGPRGSAVGARLVDRPSDDL